MIKNAHHNITQTIEKPSRAVRRKTAHRRAFSLLECLMLVVILGIIGVAAGNALQNVAKSPGITNQSLQIETQLISKMEQIRSLPFDSVAIGNPNATLSDYVTIGNALYQRTVVVAQADANGDGMADVNFKSINVTCGGQSITTYISK